MSIALKHRLRDNSASSLNSKARKVNFVWNYCNEPQKHTFETKWAWKDKWLCAEALEDLTAGSSKELDLPSPIIQKVCQQYVKSRKQHKKRWLRYRGRKSLGWVPFRNDQMLFDGKAFIFDGVALVHQRHGGGAGSQQRAQYQSA